LTEQVTERSALFTAKDRCDKCGAQAKVLALFILDGPDVGMLLFCRHHGSQYFDALIEQGATIEVERA